MAKFWFGEPCKVQCKAYSSLLFARMGRESMRFNRYIFAFTYKFRCEIRFEWQLLKRLGELF